MLRNRVTKEEGVIQGVNLAINPIKMQVGMFTSLENWIPGKVHKIKKKRGVELLVNTPPDQSVSFPCPCGGCEHALSIECQHECALGQYAQVTYSDDVSVTQPTGPAIRVNTASTPDALTGLVAIYDPVVHRIGLVLWAGEDLTDLATVLDTYDVTLAADDVLKIEADAAVPYDYHVYVNAVSVIDYTDAGHVIPLTEDCIGFVELEGATWP